MTVLYGRSENQEIRLVAIPDSDRCCTFGDLEFLPECGCQREGSPSTHQEFHLLAGMASLCSQDGSRMFPEVFVDSLYVEYLLLQLQFLLVRGQHVESR